VVDRMKVFVVGFDDLEPVRTECVGEIDRGGVGFDEGEWPASGIIPPRHLERQK
jgi:hypothetical protein